MSHVTITLPDDLSERLGSAAERLGTSVSDLVRQAIDVYLGQASAEPTTPPKPAFASIGRSGHHHTARDAEDLLAEGFAKTGRSDDHRDR